MPDEKTKPTVLAKPAPDAKNHGLEVKPVTDLKPDVTRSERVRGGGAGIGTKKLWSDVSAKADISPISDVLSRLRIVRF